MLTSPSHRVDVDALRARHRLADVVEATGVALRPAGRGYIGCCPFHEDSTPSLSVDAIPDRFHCFGCGANGDVIDFVSRLTGLGFLDAVTHLGGIASSRAGAHAQPRRHPRLEPPTRPIPDRAFEIHNLAWAYFTRPVAHAGAAAYLSCRRSIDIHGLEAVLAHPVAGMASNGWTSLTDHLMSHGVRAEELLALDLARATSRGTLIDALRSRLVLPVTDRDGRIRAFLGRDTSGHPRAPKYLNPTRTAVFDKSRMLYRADHPEPSPWAGTVVVEGPLDALAIACAYAEAGRPERLHAVATGGTAVTEHQVEAIAAMPAPVVLALDADPAGIDATHRLLRALSYHPRPPERVLLAQLPPGEDPASWLAADPKRVTLLLPDNSPQRGGPQQPHALARAPALTRRRQPAAAHTAARTPAL